MSASPKQVSIGGLETEQEDARAIEAEYVLREQLWSAMRSFIQSYLAGGQKGYDAAATALNKRWEPKGRPVTAGALRQALLDAERNNFRAEWLFWFADNCAEVAELMARKAKPEKTDRQILDDLISELANDLSHKRIVDAVRRAKTR